jgi:hypothetical protein
MGVWNRICKYGNNVRSRDSKFRAYQKASKPKDKIASTDHGMSTTVILSE